MSASQVKNVRTENISVDISKHKAFADIPKSLVPDTQKYKVSFELHNTNTAVANAVRACTMEEIEWKALSVNQEDIHCTEPDVILPELCDRIGLLPLSQDVPDDAKFSLMVANTGNSMEDLIVYSDDIKRSGGSSGSRNLPFGSRFRIAALSPGTVLRVNNIRVVTGYGYEHAKFNTCAFEFDMLDHIDVHYLTKKEQILTHMTPLSAVMKELPKSVKDPRSARILVIHDSEIVKSCSEDTRNRIKNRFDVVLENSKVMPISSSVAKPRSFFLSFTFFSKVDPVASVVKSLNTLKERILIVKKGIEEHARQARQTRASDEIGMINHGAMEISVSDPTGNAKPVATVLIRGEDEILGNVIVHSLMDIDPKIGSAQYKKIHPSNRSVEIIVMHSQPLKIIVDALQKAHDDFAQLQKNFTK